VWSSFEKRFMIVAGLSIVLLALFVHPAFADDVFSNIANNLMDLLFHKIGKILFIVLIVAALITFPKSPSTAIVLLLVAIAFAVGSGLVSSIWDLFTSGSSSSSTTGDSGQIMFAFNSIMSLV